jgi:hypothetical protein
MLTGLLDQVAPDLVSIRIAAAYATSQGVHEVLNRISTKVGDSWNDCPKQFITSLDFGLTEPAAIVYLASLDNAEVRLANSDSHSPPYRPTKSAFHPKIYILRYDSHARLLIGSPNLTQRAFTMNTEGAVVDTVAATEADALWASLWDEAVSPSTVDLDEYADWRKRSSPPLPSDTAPVAPKPSPGSLITLAEAIDDGFDPSTFEHMWVEAGSMSSGGSHNQLELPRGAQRFLGFAFQGYASTSVEHIGEPVLRTGSLVWADRKLTWHGDNRMERMNLPTLAAGGFNYVDTAVMFRRMDDGTFELHVAAWDDALAASWRSASAALGTIYRLGSSSPRIVGFF